MTFKQNDFYQNVQQEKLYQNTYSPHKVAKKWHFNLNLRIQQMLTIF